MVKNTDRATKRDIKIFERHLDAINEKYENNVASWKSFLTISKYQKCKVLAIFFKIAKKLDGTLYSNRSLKDMMNSLQRAIRDNDEKIFFEKLKKEKYLKMLLLINLIILVIFFLNLQ